MGKRQVHSYGERATERERGGEINRVKECVQKRRREIESKGERKRESIT